MFLRLLQTVSPVRKDEHKLFQHHSTMLHKPAGNYMFKVNYRNTRTRCEICLKLTIKTLEGLLFC